MEHAAKLRELVEEGAEQLGVPGVAVGIVHEGAETYVCHGVTSIENPLAVDEHTLFHIGSTTKTYTAMAIMRLVERGEIDLDATVRTYLPGFRVADEDVAAKVTVLQLLNHTAGWSGDHFRDFGLGDDALGRYVESLADLEQASEFGGTASYNNTSFNIAGHVLAVVNGTTYEQAIRELILDPLGCRETFTFLQDVITRRFAVGHVRDGEDVVVARPFDMMRSGGPSGDLLSSVTDQIRYARFHLGDGRSETGERILSEASIRKMQEPTASFAEGEQVGISWMIRDIEGVRFVAHGGTTIGLQSSFELVPERGYAFTVLANAHHAHGLNEHLVKWARETFLGIVEPEPEPLDLSAEELAQYAGTYERPEAIATVTVDGNRLLFSYDYSDAGREMVLREFGTLIPLPPPMRLAIIGPDEYYAFEGENKGLRGRFLRDDDGRIASLDLGGRIANRVDA